MYVCVYIYIYTKILCSSLIQTWSSMWEQSFNLSVHADTLQHFILCWAVCDSQSMSIKKKECLWGKENASWLTVLVFYTCFTGQSSKNISSSPSIESLSGGREFTGSPPLSASKKDSFFSTISRSRSQSKTMSRKESVSPFNLFKLFQCHIALLVIDTHFFHTLSACT